MKAKYLASFVASLASVSLVACGGGGSSDSSSPPVPVTGAPAPSPAPAPAPGPAPAPAPSPSPSPSPSPAPAPAPDPSPAAPIPLSTPETLTFPVTAYGSTSDAMTATISNVGTADLVLSLIANTAGAFRVTGGSCFTVVPVPAGGSCTVLVTFTPKVHGPSDPANMTISAQSLPDIVVPLVGSSPSTVFVTVANKTLTLPYPTVISGLPDTDPGTLATDSTASLWPLVAGVGTFGSTTASLPTPQLISTIPWPIKFALWSENTGDPQAPGLTGTGCQVDLVGPDLVVTVNGESISVAVDGTPTVLAPNGQPAYPGDVLVETASERTIGVLSVIRRLEIDAFDGDLQGQWTQLALGATYDAQGGSFGTPGIQGNLSVTIGTATSIKQYSCFDTAGQ